jgi:hypothetical protein
MMCSTFVEIIGRVNTGSDFIEEYSSTELGDAFGKCCEPGKKQEEGAILRYRCSMRRSVQLPAPGGLCERAVQASVSGIGHERARAAECMLWTHTHPPSRPGDPA